MKDQRHLIPLITLSFFHPLYAGLQIGSWFNRLLYAADILKNYSGWTEEDRHAFEGWWREQALPHKISVMKRAVNNWQDAAVLGVLTAAVVFEDRELLQECLQTLDGYFRARGENLDWKFTNVAGGTFTLQFDDA